LRRYNDLSWFRADVLDILLVDEVLNNLPISLLMDSKNDNVDDWLLATVTDVTGVIVLIALCVKPFNLLLYEPITINQNTALELLAEELKNTGFRPPGVLATPTLARRFTDVYSGSAGGKIEMKMILMRLDKLASYEKASGFCRMLTEDDLTFAPFWEQAFCIDCRIPAFSLHENEERIKTRLDKDSHFIWEDVLPVAQAVYGRDTPNGAVINWVYTPPLYRGRGYATSVVAEVSKTLFERGKSFCCLFADADNPASRRVYHKLGYYDVSEFEQISFNG